MLRFWHHWNYSLVLLAAYIGTFHFWLVSDGGTVLVSGLLSALVLGILSLFAAVQGYFVNRVDFIAHSVVIVDILLEATIIPAHSGLTFYLCAIGFAVVIGGYRFWCLRQPFPPAP
ncbi:MAG: hypothetical protein K0Q55_968 [Verrucomicrobia bacterium]|jgi:hypothetical protein|nr:hypothetical protein [Verrucomicrobiota bacterium]